MGSAIHLSEGLAEGSAGYLQMAREARGVSLEDAAVSLQISPERLRGIERGELRVPAGLIKRARVLYGFPERFFTRSMPVHMLEPQEVYMSGEGIKMCSHHSCAYCADYLCDWPMGKGKTCDAPLCEDHASEIGVDLHLCPVHAIERDARER